MSAMGIRIEKLEEGYVSDDQEAVKDGGIEEHADQADY